MDTTQTDHITRLPHGADLLADLEAADPAEAPESAEALAEMLTERLDATGAAELSA